MSYGIEVKYDSGVTVPVMDIVARPAAGGTKQVSVGEAVKAIYYDYYGIHLASDPGALKIKYRETTLRKRITSYKIANTLAGRASKVMYVGDGDRLILGRKEITVIPRSILEQQEGVNNNEVSTMETIEK